MRAIAAFLILLAACSARVSDSDTDDEVQTTRTPPETTGGGESSPGCEGVPERGVCIEGSAKYCDLDRDLVFTIACAATGKTCVEEVGRGATCAKLDADPRFAGSTPCTGTEISEAGYCSEDGNAVFCDTNGETPQAKIWKCPGSGLSCQEDQCAPGASCCGEPETPTEPANLSACEELGTRGRCETAVSYNWCSGGEFHPTTCNQGEVCLEDSSCGIGAHCCAPEEAENECQAIGISGICTPLGRVRFCTGTEDDDIIEFGCSETQTCDDYGPEGARCRSIDDVCAEIGFAGRCRGDLLWYCQAGELIESSCQECSEEGPVAQCI